jgi:hypothetical protein
MKLSRANMGGNCLSSDEVSIGLTYLLNWPHLSLKLFIIWRSLHLRTSIGFRSFHLRWVSHLLTGDLRQKRKEYAKAMLPFLHAAECDDWHHLVTGDESWFFFERTPCRMWTLSRDNVVTKPKHQIQGKNPCLQSYRIQLGSVLSIDSQMIP